MRRIQDVLPKTPEKGKKLYQERREELLVSRSPFAAEPAYEAKKARRNTPRVLNGYYSLAPVTLIDTPAFKAAVKEAEDERENENVITQCIKKIRLTSTPAVTEADSSSVTLGIARLRV